MTVISRYSLTCTVRGLEQYAVRKLFQNALDVTNVVFMCLNLELSDIEM